MRATKTRVVGGALLLVAWLWMTPASAAACTGGVAPLATGIRGASAIFYARIVSETVSSLLFYKLDLAVGRVIRGQPQSHVVHVVTPRACDQLLVGDSGIVVLGSVNPFRVGPNNLYNFFYVLGPGHTSAAEANRVLSELPATDTATPAAIRGSTSDILPIAGLAGAVAGVFVLARRKGRQALPG